MSDADTIREALERANDFRSDGYDSRYQDALAALDRLVAERDEWEQAAMHVQQLREAAEAERDEALRKENLVRCPNCLGRNSSRWPFGPCTICNGSAALAKEEA